MIEGVKNKVPWVPLGFVALRDSITTLSKLKLQLVNQGEWGIWVRVSDTQDVACRRLLHCSGSQGLDWGPALDLRDFGFPEIIPPFP